MAGLSYFWTVTGAGFTPAPGSVVRFYVEGSGERFPKFNRDAEVARQHIPGSDINYSDYGGMTTEELAVPILVAVGADNTFFLTMRGQVGDLYVPDETNTIGPIPARLVKLTNHQLLTDGTFHSYDALWELP